MVFIVQPHVQAAGTDGTTLQEKANFRDDKEARANMLSYRVTLSSGLSHPVFMKLYVQFRGSKTISGGIFVVKTIRKETREPLVWKRTLDAGQVKEILSVIHHQEIFRLKSESDTPETSLFPEDFSTSDASAYRFERMVQRRWWHFNFSRTYQYDDVARPAAANGPADVVFRAFWKYGQNLMKDFPNGTHDNKAGKSNDR